MRNELSFSNEVAPDCSLLHPWLRRGTSLRSSENLGRREAGFAVSRHTILALLIHSEGYGTALKKLLWWPVPPSLLHSEKSGNASDRDTELRWSPPGVACEPILPTPAMMRTDGTGWTRRRLGLLLGLSQGNHLHIVPTPVGGPGTAKRATGYIYPAHRSENDGLALNNGRRRQETANRTDATGSISFSP